MVSEADPERKSQAVRHAGIGSRVLAAASLAIGLGFVAWAVAYMAQPGWAMTPFMAFVLGWIAAPFAVLAFAAWRITHGLTRSLLAVALTAAAGYGIWAFTWIDEDAQGALILLFAPLWQLIGACVVAVVAVALDALLRRRNAARLVSA